MKEMKMKKRRSFNHTETVRMTKNTRMRKETSKKVPFQSKKD
jgi:hypothetical protein